MHKLVYFSLQVICCLLHLVKHNAVLCSCEIMCNNLEEQEPEYPCPDLQMSCIREYFSQYADCVPAKDGQLEDSMPVKRVQLYYPSFNTSNVQTDSVYAGLKSGRVTAFIVDKKTDLVQLTVTYKDIAITAHAVITFYYPDKLPVVVRAPTPNVTGTVNYSELVIVTVFDGIKPDIRRSQSLVVVAANTDYHFGPGLSDNPDPTVRSTVASVVDMKEVSAREGLLDRGGILQNQFIQQAVCDYGVNPAEWTLTTAWLNRYETIFWGH